MTDPIDLDAVADTLADVEREVRKRIVGQGAVLDQLLVGLLADGNVLIESNPGLGKTLLVRTIADVMDLEFSRIQNTPDLMPSDVIGTEIIRETEAGQEFVFDRGPVFANIVLADEINRATPKTQSALLEAMQEKQVTAGGETRPLPSPFFLLATENPIEQEGSLHPDETLYMNGRLFTARDALEHARTAGDLIHEGDGTRLYDVDATTQTLTPDGTLTRTDCMVYETEYDGRIYTVETKTGRSSRVTGNHPFLVNRDGEIRWIEAGNLEPGDALVSPKRLELPGRSLPSHDDAIETLEDRGYRVVRRERVRSLVRLLDSGDDLTAEEIDDLRIAAGMSKKELSAHVDASYDQVLNFIGGADNGIEGSLGDALAAQRIVDGDYVESYTTHRIDDTFDDGSAGFFVGFVLAEGSVSDTHVSVTQKNLPEKFDRWVEIAEGAGLDVAIDEDPTGRTARIHSKPFVEYLEERYGLTSPERVLSAPEAFRHEFLEIVLLTESHYDAERGRITFVQTDRTLTNVVAHLLIGVGIMPWIYDRGERYEIRIQGEDVPEYLARFEWRGKPPDRTEFETVHRTIPLPASDLERLVDILGMKYDEPLSTRDWYSAYRYCQAGETRMTAPSVDSFLDDVDRTLERRRDLNISKAAVEDLGEAAKRCGLSMLDIADGSGIDRNRIWRAYQSEDRPRAAVDFVTETFASRIAEAEALREHLDGFVGDDVFYDRVTSVESAPYRGPVVGLSVPEHHNYVAGLGACGINHNTYPLPEAQSDRFTLKILVDYPSFEEEREIVDRYTTRMDEPIPVDRVMSAARLREIQELVRQVPIADDIADEAVSLVQRTRGAADIEFGASPRASLSLVLTAKAHALLSGRTHVSAADVEAMARPVLRHRIILDFRAEREGRTPDDVIADLL